MIRRQLPAYSPVLPSQLLGAMLDGLQTPDRALYHFERHLAERYGVERVVLTASGTQALQLAMMQCKCTAGRDLVVALPAYSCYDLVSAAVGAGVRVVFYDLDPVSLTPDKESFREALGLGAGAAVAANLYGFPLDWDWLRAECRSAGATLMEDAAQGLGSGWAGVEAGWFGDFSVLSFGRGKGWNGGGGGALLARREVELSLETSGIQSAATVGISALVTSLALWAVGRPWLYRLPTMIPGLKLGETQYREPGPVTMMSPVPGAIAMRHSGASLDALATRRGWAAEWRERLRCAPDGGTPCTPLAGGTCGYLRLPLLASSPMARDERVMATRDVGSAPGYPAALPELPQARGVMLERSRPAPGAETLARTLFTLPTHPRVSRQDVEAAPS